MNRHVSIVKPQFTSWESRSQGNDRTMGDRPAGPAQVRKAHHPRRPPADALGRWPGRPWLGREERVRGLVLQISAGSIAAGAMVELTDDAIRSVPSRSSFKNPDRAREVDVTERARSPRGDRGRTEGPGLFWLNLSKLELPTSPTSP